MSSVLVAGLITALIIWLAMTGFCDYAIALLALGGIFVLVLLVVVVVKSVIEDGL